MLARGVLTFSSGLAIDTVQSGMEQSHTPTVGREPAWTVESLDVVMSCPLGAGGRAVSTQHGSWCSVSVRLHDSHLRAPCLARSSNFCVCLAILHRHLLFVDAAVRIRLVAPPSAPVYTILVSLFPL
jgi:hypothetical protein